MRRYGQQKIPEQTYQLRPGVYAILVRGTDVLLTHQSDPTPEFQLPGGGIDPGESPIAALHREVFEETGWRISPPKRLGIFRHFTYMPEYNLWADKVCTVYVSRPIRRHGPPSEAGHTAVWTNTSEAANFVGNAGARAFLNAFFA